MSKRGVYQIVDDRMETMGFCETCIPKKNAKIYVDEPHPEYGGTYWCEDCVKKHNRKILGWVTGEEYEELRRNCF
jgi:hypothetical protein